MKGFAKWTLNNIGCGFLCLILGLIIPLFWFVIPFLPFVIIAYPLMKLTMPEYMRKKGF